MLTLRDRFLVFTLAIVLFLTAFYLGWVSGQRRAVSTEDPILQDALGSAQVSEAAILWRILAEHRAGDEQAVTRLLERMIDNALLSAWTYWEEAQTMRVFGVEADWNALQEDRRRYPRQATDVVREQRIAEVIQLLGGESGSDHPPPPRLRRGRREVIDRE